MIVLGKTLLIAVLLINAFAFLLSMMGLRVREGTVNKYFLRARECSVISCILYLLIYSLFIYAFIDNNFFLLAVSKYSSINMPILYKISASWAGLSGSFLLWAFLVSIFCMLNIVKTEEELSPYNSYLTLFSAGVCLAFILICVFFTNPFEEVREVLRDGQGLNPLLQSIWMIVHPPLLFIGYASLTVPFIIILSAVYSSRFVVFELYGVLRFWLLVGIVFLAAGLITGAKWSYVELGWGGFWAWDPVENASLLPFLVAAAAFHSLIGIQYSDKFKMWSVILIPVPFLLTILATSITRSGMLKSLHSFDENNIASFYFILLGILTVLWIWGIWAGNKITKSSDKNVFIFGFDKYSILCVLNISFVVLAFIIGIATFWPVIGSLFDSSKVQVVLTSSFFNYTAIVAAIVLALLLGLNAFADFYEGGFFILKALICIIVSVIAFKVTAGQIVFQKWIIASVCASAVFGFMATVLKFFHDLVVKRKMCENISHIGLMVFIFAAALSADESVYRTTLAKGTKAVLGKNEVTYSSFVHGQPDKNGITKVGPKLTCKDNDKMVTLYPHVNLYSGDKNTNEVDIYMGWKHDIYSTFNGVTQDGKVSVDFMIKPMMLWVWVGLGIILLGLVIAIVEKHFPYQA
jgi:cytochrome c-type biogenesis protein CcmF